MYYKLLIRRGMKANLPSLDVGELALCTDTKEIFIGTLEGNLMMYPVNEGGGSVTVTKSEINGNIVINGQEVQVYDDRILKNTLSTKADVTHKHSLADISDIDATSKVNGNILQYDSSISKFKSVPMPTGSGGGSTTLGGLIDVDMTTVPPTNGNVLKFQGGKWKPSAEISASNVGSGSYLIELDRWGIKQGLPTKPYVDANYIDADKNIQGINDALKYAYDNGFSEAVLPRGKYALCFPKEIIMQSYLTFNLNGSTLKVIYDSDKKSPFDTRTTDDYYNFKGNTLLFSKVKFAHLTGGIIIGCRDDRSFANPSEVAMEHSYGVLFEKGASYNSVTHCIVRDYMGDNVSVSSNGTFAYGEFDQGLELQGLNYTTGQPTASTNTVTTRLLDIPQDLTPKVDCMLISGVGYARMTNLNSKDLDIFFYDKNNAFIGVMKSRRIYTEMSVPVNATKFRLQFLNETSASKTMQITIMFGGLPHHNEIEYNEIFNGHRGGVTLGGNYNTVQHNVIRDNGKGLVRFLDGKPIFNDPTRYSINMEDSYGANCVIRDNQFYGSYHGILVGCYSVIIEDNYFYNIDYIAINLYSLVQANIRGNYFHNCMNNLGLMSSNFSSANVTVTDNTFVGGSMSLDNSAYRVMLAENHYHNPTFIALGDNCSFVNNYVIYTTTLPTVPIFSIKKAVGCVFKAMSESTEITFKSYRFDGCTFEKLTLRAEPVNTKTREDTVFKDCDIISCSFRNHIFSGAPVKVTISDSKITDTTFEAGITNTDNQNPYVSLEDCNIKITTKDKLFLSDINRAYATLRAVRCEVEIANPSFAYLLYSSGSKVNYVYLKDCNFAYTGAVTPLALKYYVNKSHIKEFISTGNRFDNITLPVADEGVFKGYDPNHSDVAEPSYGYYSLGKIVYNAKPTAGGILGWICIQEGVATSVNWTASTAYVKGDLVLSGSKAYECVLGGTSSTVAPTQTTGQVKEGTVTWKYVGTKAIFKNFGLIAN